MLYDFISFDKMITPTIIKILFWIGVVISVIIGLGAIISGCTAAYGGGAQVLGGIVVLIVGPITARVYCEILIVLFKMHQSLIDIRKSLQGREQGSTDADENLYD